MKLQMRVLKALKCVADTSATAADTTSLAATGTGTVTGLVTAAGGEGLLFSRYCGGFVQAVCGMCSQHIQQRHQVGDDGDDDDDDRDQLREKLLVEAMTFLALVWVGMQGALYEY